MKMNNFLKNILPWIVIALLMLTVPTLWNIFNSRYNDIIYSGRPLVFPTNVVTVIPTENIVVTDTPCLTDTPIAIEKGILVINKESLKIHIDTCYHAKRISDKNKYVIETDNIEYQIHALINDGYSVCGVCCKKYQTE